MYVGLKSVSKLVVVLSERVRGRGSHGRKAMAMRSLLLLLLDNLCGLDILHQHRSHVSIVRTGRTRLFWSLDIVVDRNDPIRE